MHPVHRDILLSLASLTPAPPWPSYPLDRGMLAPYPLRDYQLDILLEVIRLMELGHRRILIVLPTGGGKTVLASAMLGSASRLGHLSQFIVHRRELIKQTSKTFTGAAIDHGFIASGWPVDFTAPVILAGIQTLVRRLHLVMPPDLVVLDEAHHGTASMWARTLEHYGDSHIVGLTATPERLDGRGLGEHFDVMVIGPSVAELIAWGYLSQFDYFGPHVPDLRGVNSDGGAAVVMDRPHLIGDIVEHYLALAAGQQGIGFAVNREHSRKIVDAFLAHGIRAAHVDGDTDDDERDRIDAAFRAGDLDIMSNVDLFGEGYDVPGAVYLGDWAPSKSSAKVAQRRGRVLRTAAGKGRAVMADHAGNWVAHGMPDDERDYSLEGRGMTLRSAGPSDAMPIRQCLACYLITPSTNAICPRCETPFPSHARAIETRAGRLSKIDREMAKQAKEEARLAAAAALKAAKRECKTFADFEALAIRNGYSNPEGWARMQMKFKRNYKRK